MAYSTIAEIAGSTSLQTRIAGAAAQEGVDLPVGWAATHAWEIAASPEWADNWAYAVDTATVNVNPDTGARNDVISDAMILAAVQALIAAETPSA